VRPTHAISVEFYLVLLAERSPVLDSATADGVFITDWLLSYTSGGDLTSRY
jgi:hypothetical protein